MRLRNFELGDEKYLWDIFYSAIHRVCAKDYTQEQIYAWAPDDVEMELWKSKVRSINPIVAELDGQLVGYSDLQKSGLIDHFFVHGEYQRQGVGDRLVSEILQRGSLKDVLYSEVSHTARPFYERYGFKVLKQQTVTMRGVALTNSLMERRKGVIDPLDE